MSERSYWDELFAGCEPDCEPEHDRFDDDKSRAAYMADNGISFVI